MSRRSVLADWAVATAFALGMVGLPGLYAIGGGFLVAAVDATTGGSAWTIVTFIGAVAACVPAMFATLWALIRWADA